MTHTTITLYSYLFLKLFENSQYYLNLTYYVKLQHTFIINKEEF